MDNSRTIERIIVSYNNRCEHIETINKDKDIDKDQREKCLKELESQKNNLILSIKQIDPSMCASTVKSSNNFQKGLYK